MYGTEEHREAVRRMGEAAKYAEAAETEVASLRVDLCEDEPDTTAKARGLLRNAQLKLASALADLDKAVVELPTPAARSTVQIHLLEGS
jgi:regulator of sirC expression with transglutaminase-like and TPR domain